MMREVIERIAKIYEKEGSDCWFTDDPQKISRHRLYDAKDYDKTERYCRSMV